MSRKTIKIGDVFEITLSGGKKAYGQYVFMDKMGPMIQVFDLITEDAATLDEIKNAKPLFPPVITGLFAAIRTGFWKVVGHLPVKSFKYPNFVSTLFNTRTGKASMWFLYDGKIDKPLGEYLPEKYKKLEFLVTWDPHDIIDRIETGEHPYPFGELIKYNEYTPQPIE